MSEFREDLLISPINKKRVIGIFIVCILLISLFAFSVLIYSFIFGSQRLNPNDRLSDNEWEDYDLTLPPFPYNASDFQDFFDDLNLTQDQLQDLIDTLQDMFDGDVDDLDLNNFSQSQLALLASEIEVFRVYEYDNFNNMTNKLWKYECFDEYNGDGWHSTAATQLSDFYPYNDYSTYHSDKDLFRIKMPLSPNMGENSFVIPTLFPTPFIIENQVYSEPPNFSFGSESLSIDDLNSTVLDLNFNSEEDVNLSYYLFGLNLPNNYEINASAKEAMYTPATIQSRYLQLPPTINVYLANNFHVYDHYLLLNNTIKESDNAFVVANKIRNYLQTYFTFPLDQDDYNPAPEGRDTVDWFCETQQGVWADFASAFCVFLRIFGVASRFVDGFNSFGIEEMWDQTEGLNTFAIKYRNIYSWAEVFIPTDTFGNGQWVQMDVLFDSFGGGGNPIVGGNYSLSLSADKLTYNRPDIANLTAFLSSISEPINNQRITFRDVTSGEILGQDFTNTNGQASILVDINNSIIVGPHVIEARFDFFLANYTFFTVPGNIEVELTVVNPTTVNRSDSEPDITNVQGYVIDPLNGKPIKNAEVNFRLLQFGTNNEIVNAFIPSSQYTDTNGVFDEFLNIDPSVSSGQYEVRVDFNGTWLLPIFDIPFTSPVLITNSSQKIRFNITKALTVLFYIESFSAQDVNNPSINRYDTLNLTARLILENIGPVANRRIYFYDYSRGYIEVGNEITDSNGIASINYSIGDDSIAGPNLLVAQHNMQQNFSYFILNEDPSINIISGPNPREINRTVSGASNTVFNIEGEIIDSINGSPIQHCEISLKLLMGGFDYSNHLIPSEYFWTDGNGYFNLNFEVDQYIPTGNYTLRLDFNGTTEQPWDPVNQLWQPFYFNLPNFNTSSTFESELLVSTPATLAFNFWINGTTSNDYQQPVINRNGDLDLSVNLTWGGIPLADGQTIDFYDVTQNYLIGTAYTSSGFAQILYSTNLTTSAGPHLVYARWGSNYNYSYFILDDQITTSLDVGPDPRWVYSSGSTNRNFNIHGFIRDFNNLNPIKYAQITVHMYDGPIDVSHFLNLETGTYNLDETGEYDLTFSVSSSTPAKNYTMRVEFYGTFLYSSPNNLYNEYDFFLSTYPNFNNIANGLYELEVIDPDDINLRFFVDGKPTLSFYNDNNPPNRYNRLGSINFSIYLTQSGSPVNTGTVSFTDYYTGDSLGTQSVVNGYASELVDISSWHAGLHQVRVQWSGSSTFNYTYVIINETISITPSSSLLSIQRDYNNFWVDTNVQDGLINLNGLRISLILLDSTMSDVSGNLNPQFYNITISNGYYRFNINSISLSCPEGQYYLRVDFNGSISEAGIFLRDYMVHASSSPILINVSAGTSITGNYDTRVVKDGFYEGDELYAYGYLRWDNGTAIAFKEVNITIRNSLGDILTSATGFTDANGFFNITITIGSWPDNAEVWANFYPEDSFSAPRHYYIKSSEQQLFREP